MQPAATELLQGGPSGAASFISLAAPLIRPHNKKSNSLSLHIQTALLQ
jgi:hypothetical protein